MPIWALGAGDWGLGSSFVSHLPWSLSLVVEVRFGCAVVYRHMATSPQAAPHPEPSAKGEARRCNCGCVWFLEGRRLSSFTSTRRCLYSGTKAAHQQRTFGNELQLGALYRIHQLLAHIGSLFVPEVHVFDAVHGRYGNNPCWLHQWTPRRAALHQARGVRDKVNVGDVAEVRVVSDDERGAGAHADSVARDNRDPGVCDTVLRRVSDAAGAAAGEAVWETGTRWRPVLHTAPQLFAAPLKLQIPQQFTNSLEDDFAFTDRGHLHVFQRPLIQLTESNSIHLVLAELSSDIWVARDGFDPSCHIFDTPERHRVQSQGLAVTAHRHRSD
mmetsp:Transcript_8879/g.25335  ORF Transcript_8879/g.25335 Transcript_8879/m.25335 type:complete len:328 (-) Transcript_8879:127-1110(-)